MNSFIFQIRNVAARDEYCFLGQTRLTSLFSSTDPRLIKVLSVCGSILVFLLFFLGLCCAIKWVWLNVCGGWRLEAKIKYYHSNKMYGDMRWHKSNVFIQCHQICSLKMFEPKQNGCYSYFRLRKFMEKPIPNPGLSSVAKWLSQNHQKVQLYHRNSYVLLKFSIFFINFFVSSFSCHTDYFFND